MMIDDQIRDIMQIFIIIKLQQALIKTKIFLNFVNVFFMVHAITNLIEDSYNTFSLQNIY